jgi:hypothetical protein
MSEDNIKKGGAIDPFQTYDSPYKQNMNKPWEPFGASAIASTKDQQHRNEISGKYPTSVSFPPHLYIPADAQSVDIRNLANVPPATTVTLLSFKGKQGSITKFINYSVYFDALLFSLVNLVPKVNGIRVFPFHGNPNANYKIGLGTGSDLSNGNLISCQLDLQPNDELVWEFTNNDVVDVAAGVRMVGYLDQSTIRKTGRFGG